MSDSRSTGLTERLGVLGERNFRLFFTGYATSLFGAAMVPVALTFAVLNQGYGATDVGYVLAAETVPLVGLLLIGGVVADRFPRRASMLGADLVRFGSEGLLAVLLLTGSPRLWMFMVLAGVLGAGQAFFNPAMTGLMPEMVSSERLQAANGLRGVASSTGQILGPSVAGIIVAAGGAGWAIAIDSATYGVSAACLWRLAIPPRPASTASSLISQLAGGWYEFRSRTWLWVVVSLMRSTTMRPFNRSHPKRPTCQPARGSAERLDHHLPTGRRLPGGQPDRSGLCLVFLPQFHDSFRGET